MSSPSSYIVPPPCILPKITQCSPRVWRILGCNPSPMTLGGTNTFLIGTGRSRILIDSGEGVSEYFDLLKEVVTKTQTESISHLLLTHWHHDHTKGCKDVLRLFPDCKVGKIKSRVMTNDKLEPLVFPRTSSEGNNNNNKHLFDIEHGQEFETEGATIKAMFTPGHSDDHLIFYEKNEKAVFTGDCILGYGSSVFASFPDFMQSLHFIKQINPVRLYPAHGPNVPSSSSTSTSDDNGQQTTTEEEEEKSRKETSLYIQNYIHHRLKREGQVLKVLETKGEDTSENKKTMNLMSIVDEVYGEQIAGQPKLRAGAAGNTLHILKKLVLENKVAVDFSEHNNSNNNNENDSSPSMSEEEVQGLLDTTKDYSNDVYLARIAAEHQNKKEGEACSCSPEAQNLLLQKVEKLKWKLA